MLVLSREPDQEIIIDLSGLTTSQLHQLARGKPIRVMVSSVNGSTVRLGIDAPHCVTIHRREVYETIRRERRMHRISGWQPATKR